MLLNIRHNNDTKLYLHENAHALHGRVKNIIKFGVYYIYIEL